MKVLAVPYLDHENPENLKDVFIIPDSSMQRSDRPFFIPDVKNPPRISVSHILRVCKVGKPSSPKFAERYYEAWSVAVNFIDIKSAGESFSPAYSRAFQNSLSTGEFQHFAADGCLLPEVDLTIGDTAISLPSQSDITAVDRLIYALGQRFSLRTGDLIIPGFTDTGLAAECDVHISCSFKGKRLLSFNIK